MGKPIVIINPITGQRSYTKHPEKLTARNRIEKVNQAYFGFLVSDAGYGIRVADRWKSPHTAFESGALYEPPDIERNPKQNLSAYQLACKQLGVHRPGEVVS